MLLPRSRSDRSCGCKSTWCLESLESMMSMGACYDTRNGLIYEGNMIEFSRTGDGHWLPSDTRTLSIRASPQARNLLPVYEYVLSCCLFTGTAVSDCARIKLRSRLEGTSTMVLDTLTSCVTCGYFCFRYLRVHGQQYYSSPYVRVCIL